MVAMRFRPGGCFRFVVGRGVLLCCTVCVFFWALLVVPAAHGQVIEEGGFPVKGGVSGEPFSLSCPPRLVAQAGESVLLSCAAAAVPEEGVRYAWESLSGDGLRLLSNANERSPLFTAPLSGESAEYVYRLTAMSVGVYETATVTVVVGGVSGGSVQDRGKPPVALEGCDSFGALEGFQEGCVAGDKTPPFFEPFEGDPEGEGGPGFLFPEAPGLPDQPSGPVRGGGFDRQTPPRLECPVAVFLEELETGSIECHAWDASGQEYLEYSWEPVGSTTRDYLDNPRLLPENAPNPSVVAPETPVYETLESFHSGETTFRYRYRLTAISRATGLSSSSEVEVFVSSSRPSVYCPLEVVVEEGETIALDCEGVDPLSARMDYDEEGASIWWEWEGLWGTSTAHLAATHLSSPLFTAPPGSAGEEYHYIASMTSSASGVPRTARRRVTVTVSEAGAGVPITSDDIRLDNGQRSLPPSLDCDNPYTVYEGASDIMIDCEVTGGSSGTQWTWTWEGHGNTPNTNQLTNTDTGTPTFAVPPNVTGDKKYSYKVTVEGFDAGVNVVLIKAATFVTVKERPDITVTCEDYSYDVDEGAPDFAFDCEASGAPDADPEDYTWSWSPSTNLKSGSETTATPTFAVPDNVDQDYTYTATVSAANADDGTATVTVTVRRIRAIDVKCLVTPHGPRYEGSRDIEIDCRATHNRIPQSDFKFLWTARGDTQNTSLLSATEEAEIIFYVPETIPETTSYTYTLKTWADTYPHIDPDYLDFTFRIFNKPDITVTCEDYSYDVDEDTGNIEFDCEASGVPGADPEDYTWSWSPTTDLTDHDTNSPTFAVQRDVPQGTTYTYTVTASAANAEDGTATVTVTVRDTDTDTPPPPPVVTCNDSEEYEGAADITLNCSVTNEPSGAMYSWAARGSTSGTDDLTNTDSLRATFSVPSDIDEPGGADKDYEYTVTLSAGGADVASADITVTVLEKPDIQGISNLGTTTVWEGIPDFRVTRGTYTGAPEGSSYEYRWTARNSTARANLRLSDPDIQTPEFLVPKEISADETYEYTLTVSAENADPREVSYAVIVKNKFEITVTCPGNPYEAYEGPDDIVLDCSASGAPEGAFYEYAWTPRGATLNTDELSSTTVEKPMFKVPGSVDSNETYEYTLTVSAGEDTKDGVASVTVKVLNKPSITARCLGNRYEVNEGSENFVMSCVATGAPGENPEYMYAWTVRGNTPDTALALLSGRDIAAPTFYVPGEVESDQIYRYLVTVSAENAVPGLVEVTVTVKNREAANTPVISVSCVSPSEVYEGSPNFALDCVASGAPGDDPQYTYAWTGDASAIALLDADDVASPNFFVPSSVQSDETYEYTLTASAENAENASADVTVRVLNKKALDVVCATPSPVYEGSEDFDLDCAATGAPAGSAYEYAWTARSSTSDTALLSATDVSSPLFYVPDAVSSDETYEYTLTVRADNAEDATADVTVRVLDKKPLEVVCATPSLVYEGSEDFALDCVASGAPAGSVIEYVWTGRESTSDTDLLISGTDGPTPTFAVPETVDDDETYEYLLTVSAENAIDATAAVTVKVLKLGSIALVCAPTPLVYEGSEDFELDCTISGDTGDTDYAYAWTARGDTQGTSLLSAVDIASPTFLVPDEIAATTTYEYLLTASAENAESASAEVTVLNRGALAVACAPPPLVYEGAEDFDLECTASGAPSGSAYEYAWTARGSTENTDLLTSGTDGPTPTFAVPDVLDATTTYEYLLTVSAENAESASAEVTVTVLNRGALSVVCADPPSVYEGSEDFAFDCSASGAPAGSNYTYAWAARGNTSDISLLSAADVASPTFYVPDQVDEDETHEYRLTVTTSAGNIDPGTFDLTVNVYDSPDLEVVCTDRTVYEGSPPVRLECTASGGPPGVLREWDWSPDTHLTGPRIRTPVFTVPTDVESDMTFTYTATVTAGSMLATGELTVTVLNKSALAVVCADPGSVYEGSEDITFDCSASGAPGDNPQYTYAWTARGGTANTDLLIAGTDGPSPTFAVPDEVEEDETYEYTLTVSADNAEDASAEVTVTVLDRVQTPPSEPVSPPVDSPPPLASSSSTREPSDPSALGVTISASPLRFGVQSADTEVSLDPMTDGISTYVSGPYHAGRMTLSPDGSEDIRENGEMALSVELASPVVLRREGGIEAASIVLSPSWSLAESCEQLSSQAIGSLYTEVTLSEDACRLLRFGGELDLTDVPSGQYTGSMDLILRSGEREETHTVEVDVTVIPAQQVITIGPRGVRFSTSRELPVGLTEEQNLSIYPHVAFLTEEKPHGVFELSNPSLIPLEISVSARFGYTEVTENGREVVVEDASVARLSDLSEVVDIRPGVLVLQPGEKGLIRYGVKEEVHVAMAEKGYAAFFDVVSEPRQYVRSDRMPEEVSGEKTARVTMRVPGVYVPGEGALQLRATLSSISYVGSLSATFLVETQDHPFVGEVVAYDGDGRELGRRETLVYTRSRVRVPLDRIPEEGTVFLRFSPRGSGRAPEPASVEWDAPRRDIGAAEDKDRATTTETLARKP